MILSRKKHGVSDEHIVITREFFSILSTIKDSDNFDENARALVISNEEACMELYRHCLCLALDLDSKLSYNILNCIVDCVSKYLRNALNSIDISDKNVEYKKGFVEACMHCIVMSRNHLRGDVL